MDEEESTGRSRSPGAKIMEEESLIDLFGAIVKECMKYREHFSTGG